MMKEKLIDQAETKLSAEAAGGRTWIVVLTALGIGFVLGAVLI